MTPDTTASPSRPATVSAGMEQKPQVKVWQPQGFEGLEVEQLNPGPPRREPQYIPAYSIQVAFQANAQVRYRGQFYTLQLRQPTVIVQQPGEVWAYDCLSETPLIVQAFEIDPSLFDHFATELAVQGACHFPDLIVDGKQNDHLVGLTLRAFTSFERSASLLERESRLLTLVSAVIRHCADDPPPERRLGREHRAVGLTKNFLREHVEDDVTLTDLAALTGLSKDHLIRVFARDVGLTPHVYQTNLRVYKAKKLLAAGTSIAETALLTGFTDQSHLHHKFKKYVLVTPGEYQRACVPKRDSDTGGTGPEALPDALRVWEQDL